MSNTAFKVPPGTGYMPFRIVVSNPAGPNPFPPRTTLRARSKRPIQMGLSRCHRWHRKRSSSTNLIPQSRRSWSG